MTVVLGANLRETRFVSNFKPRHERFVTIIFEENHEFGKYRDNYVSYF